VKKQWIHAEEAMMDGLKREILAHLQNRLYIPEKEEQQIVDVIAAWHTASLAKAREEALELADAVDDLLNTMLNSRTFEQRERVAKGIVAVRALRLTAPGRGGE
jgi:hypothetical protein